MLNVNSAAVNTRIHVSFSNLVSSEYMPSSGTDGSYGNSISSFLRNLLMFSIVAVPVEANSVF